MVNTSANSNKANNHLSPQLVVYILIRRVVIHGKHTRPLSVSILPLRDIEYDIYHLENVSYCEVSGNIYISCVIH
jgi:hypothetical protein